MATQLANKFILVSNIEAADGGKAIVAGNERVIRARLSDAKFFYETDLKTQLEDAAAEAQGDRVPREARHPGGADRAHRAACGRARAAGRRRSREGRARRAPRQGRPAHRDGRRIPRAAGADGEVLRGRRKARTQRRARDRGSLQAARALRPRADRSGVDRGRAGRQDRYAGGLLGDRREADRLEGPICAAARGFGRDQDRLENELRLRCSSCRRTVRPKGAAEVFRAQATRTLGRRPRQSGFFATALRSRRQFAIALARRSVVDATTCSIS